MTTDIDRLVISGSDCWLLAAEMTGQHPASSSSVHILVSDIRSLPVHWICFSGHLHCSHPDPVCSWSCTLPVPVVSTFLPVYHLPVCLAPLNWLTCFGLPPVASCKPVFLIFSFHLPVSTVCTWVHLLHATLNTRILGCPKLWPTSADQKCNFITVSDSVTTDIWVCRAGLAVAVQPKKKTGWRLHIRKNVNRIKWTEINSYGFLCGEISASQCNVQGHFYSCCETAKHSQ